MRESGGMIAVGTEIRCDAVRARTWRNQPPARVNVTGLNLVPPRPSLDTTTTLIHTTTPNRSHGWSIVATVSGDARHGNRMYTVPARQLALTRAGLESCRLVLWRGHL